jgi:hypothetical protein
MNINPNQFQHITIPHNKLLARLGFAHGITKLDYKTKEMIDTESSLSLNIISPKQVISSSKINAEIAGVIALQPGFSIKSSKIYALLKNCSLAYGFAVTIGPGLEEKRNKYIKDKETTRALILDAIGSVLAEELADITNEQIITENYKKKTTMRFSPGFGDWELPSQLDFLKWLGAEQIGIKLNKNFQMIPEKSVSAILGVK